MFDGRRLLTSDVSSLRDANDVVKVAQASTERKQVHRTYGHYVTVYVIR